MQDRFLREKEVKEFTGLSRTTRWRLEKKGLFPKRRKIGIVAVGWYEYEIKEWACTRNLVDNLSVKFKDL